MFKQKKIVAVYAIARYFGFSDVLLIRELAFKLGGRCALLEEKFQPDKRDSYDQLALSQ